MKKLISALAIIILVLSVGVLMSNSNKSLAAGGSFCPSQTTYTSNSAILVGEIRDTGGDPNIATWFEWGTSSSLGNSTPQENFYITQTPFRFCATIANLQPCTTYYYRAVAKNSAGTMRGEVYSFRTVCMPVIVDIKANGSDGPLTINYGDSLTISWSSSNAQSCTAFGNAPSWSGSKPTSGSQSFSGLAIGTYTFTLTCYGPNSNAQQDSVTVTVKAKAPVVVTLPAVETL